MSRFIYPGGIILLSVAGNRWLETPKFDAVQGTLDEHTATLATLSQKMATLSQKMTTLSEKMDKVAGRQELLVLRQKRAHHTLEQRVAELRNMRGEA